MSYPIGETKTFAKFCDVGVTSLELVPPTGFEWLLNFFYIYHNDDNPGGIPTWWAIKDHEDGGLTFYPKEDVMAYEMVYFPNEGVLPVRFNHSIYPVAHCQVQANKFMVVMGMFIERPSQLELSLQEWASSVVARPLPSGLQHLRYRIDYYRGGV